MNLPGLVSTGNTCPSKMVPLSHCPRSAKATQFLKSWSTPPPPPPASHDPWRAVVKVKFGAGSQEENHLFIAVVAREEAITPPIDTPSSGSRCRVASCSSHIHSSRNLSNADTAVEFNIKINVNKNVEKKLAWLLPSPSVPIVRAVDQRAQERHELLHRERRSTWIRFKDSGAATPRLKNPEFLRYLEYRLVIVRTHFGDVVRRRLVDFECAQIGTDYGKIRVVEAQE